MAQPSQKDNTPFGRLTVLKGFIMRQLLNTLGIGIVLIASLLSGCGGGSGGGGAADPAPAGSTSISGSVVKGPVNGATVTARAANTGNILGTTTTSINGTYLLTISYNGDVVIEIENGNYITPMTYIAYGYAGNTSAGFNTALTNLATQFGLGSTNLLTTLPAVSGTVNDYGRVLRAMSQYVQSQRLANFEAFIDVALNPTTFTAMQANFAAAFNTINGSGSPLTFAFNGAGISIGGTGVGGGAGTCGVQVSGTISGIPINQAYCISGIAAGSCNSSLNTNLNTVLQGSNLNYVYSSSCASGAFAINLTP
jgi:hypothetical protein